MKKYIIPATVLGLFLIQSCRKSDQVTADHTIAGLSVADAKAWYELTTPGQALQANLTGGAKGKPFSPQWSQARSGEDHEYYVVETPLQFKVAPGFSINSDGAIGGRTVLLILKSKSRHIYRTILMHTIDQAGGADDLTYLRRSNRFNGIIFFTDIDGQFINGWMYKNGKTVAASRPAPDGKETARAPLQENCETKEIKRYERTCVFYNDYSIECSSWQYVGSTYHTYCTEEGSGGVSGGDECDIPDGREFVARSGPNSESISSLVGTQQTGPGGEITRTWSARWKIYTGYFLRYEWRYYSFETGVHKKVNNVWKWKSIKNHAVGQDGSSPFNTSFRMIMATGRISANETTATMELTYEVKMCISCKGLNFGCFPEIADSRKNWTLLPNGSVVS